MIEIPTAESTHYPPWANGTQYMEWECRNCMKCAHYDFDDYKTCPIWETILAALGGTREWTEEDDKAVGYPGDENGFSYTWDCPSRNAGVPVEDWPVFIDCADQLPLEGCEVKLKRAGIVPKQPKLKVIDTGFCDICAEDIHGAGLMVDDCDYCALCSIDEFSQEVRIAAICEATHFDLNWPECIKGSALYLIERYGAPDTPEGVLNFMIGAFAFGCGFRSLEESDDPLFEGGPF